MIVIRTVLYIDTYKSIKVFNSLPIKLYITFEKNDKLIFC